MGQALYRKYRSKSLDEIVGQEHITDTLAQAIKNGRISHAYLFTGPRGVGKTSIARILAHEINGLPYNHEDNHIDIIEIDAASNRGIDEIRDLREKVYMAPTAGKYKVYIIDEVHMLTTQAFNALLKTLEEPPQHVVFILATTEAHKLPETIISRTQRHVFKPVETEKVVAHLKSIAKAEKITVDDDALQVFAEHGGGSFRDSISLLDQAGGSAQKIDRVAAETMLGIPPNEAIDKLLQAIQSGSAAASLTLLESMQNQGYHSAALAKQLSARLRASFISEELILDADRQLQLMRSLLDVAPASDPYKTLELVVLRAMPLTQTSASAPATTAPVQAAAPPASKKAVTVQPEVIETPVEAPKISEVLPPEPTANAGEIAEETAPDVQTTLTALDASVWPDILEALKSKYNTLYGVMRMAVPEFSEGKMTLRFRFAFHQKRMNEVKHREIVANTIKQLTGQNIAIECIYDKDAQLSESPIGSNSATAPAKRPEVPAASLSTISNIFGGGELLES